MKKLIVYMFWMSSVFALEAKTDSTHFSNRKRIMELGLESNLMKIGSSFQFNRIGWNGTIQLGYFISNKWSSGLFYSKMTDISKSNTYYIIDQKVIDVSTSELSNIGLYTKYNLITEERLDIVPELRLGYGRYTANSANFNRNATKNTIELEMYTIQPRVNFIYNFNDQIGFGLSGGYLIPFNYLHRADFKEYDLQNINIGLNLLFKL